MRSSFYLSLGLAFGLTGSAFGQSAWIRQEVFDKIQINGYRRLGFHSHSVQGNRNTFNSLTYGGYGSERFTDFGNMSLVGNNVMGLFNFQFSFADNRFDDPENKKFSLNFDRGGVTVDAGDIYGSLLNTNSLASISRTLKGVQAGYKNKKFAVKMLTSQTKGSAKTITIQGNNSPGPYYVQNGRLVTGSESVMVDNVPQKLNSDYIIDYYAGSITFERSIPPTSTIVITYEAYDYNVGGGSVSGVGTSYDMGKFGKIGLTYLGSKSSGNSSLMSRKEQFEGFGAPSTPYFLQYVPLNSAQFPTVVKVDGITQTEGADYFFDLNNPSIFYFTRFIPTTSIVEVLYTPKPTSVEDGDREVVGIDYRLPFGKEGSYLQYSQAEGKLTNTLTPLKGLAQIVGGTYKRGGLTVSSSWRRIPDTFVSVESRGFNRNDTGFKNQLEYKTGPLRYYAFQSNSDIRTRTIDGDGNSIVNPSTENQLSAGMSFTKSNVGYGLDLNRISTKRPGYSTTLDTIQLTGRQEDSSNSRGPGKFNTAWSLQQQNGEAYDGVNRKLSMTTLGYDLQYKPSREWSVISRTSISQIRYAGDSGTGRDISLNANYRPNERFNVNARVIDSDSGAFATLAGFQGAYGSGYDGNGFSGGLGSTPIVGGSNVRSYGIGANWMPNRKMSLDARVDVTRTTGGYSSNTDSTNFQLGGSMELPARHILNFSLNQTTTKFMGSNLTSNSTYLQGVIDGRPPGPWSYRIGGNMLLSGGGQFGQNSIYGEGMLTYRVDARQNVGFRFYGNRSTGYLPQQESFFSLFYEHQLFNNVSLIGSYKIRDLRSLGNTPNTNGYSSRGFDLELSFSFGR